MAKHERSTPRRRWWKPLLIVAGVLVALMLAVFVALWFILGRAAIEPYEKSPTYNGLDMLEHDLPAIDENNVVTAPSRAPLEPIPQEEEEVLPEESAPSQEETPSQEDPIDDGTTMQQLMRNWCANGEAVSSDQVLNILLVGVDHEDVTINGRADSLILFSVNTQTGTVTLASLLRDQYAYIATANGESFEKMHLSNVRGGPEQLIDTVEAHYKVQIDNYVMVSLATFPRIIDRLGGVTLTLTEAEATVLGGSFAAGTQRLNGAQALRFSRLRSLDSDQARTGRQRQVLTALMTELRGASAGDLVGIVNDLLPYVRTGFTQSQMLALAGRAISEGWLRYDIRQLHTPDGDCWRGVTIDKLWYWLVDYPVAAHDLQMALYGRSNITLRDDRISFLSYPVR